MNQERESIDRIVATSTKLDEKTRNAMTAGNEMVRGWDTPRLIDAMKAAESNLLKRTKGSDDPELLRAINVHGIIMVELIARLIDAEERAKQ